MAKILLIKSNNVNVKVPTLSPPLGLMYIASYIKQKRSDEVRIFDTRLSDDPLGEIHNVIKEFTPDIVGISALTLEAPTMYKIARRIKQISKAFVIVGGPHATSDPHDTMKDKNIDVVVIGEGEIAFYELVNALLNGKSLSNITGVAYRKDYDIIINSAREYIANLDELPFPAWDLINLDGYSSQCSISSIGIRPYMVLFTSRGCPFHCTYCHNIFGKRFRARSVGNVIEEMKILIEQYHINDFEILDDISNFDIIRIKSILHTIIEKNWKLRLSFPNGVRADMLDEEAVYLMKKAGTATMIIAIETASPRLQKLIKKNINLEKVEKIIKMAVDAGIFVMGTFMLGFPTETKEEMKATVNFACRSKLHLAYFFIVNYFKGSEIYKQANVVESYVPDLDLEDFSYYNMTINTTAMPDKDFHRIYRRAYLRFYINPMRIFRIVRDKPMYNDLLIKLKNLVVIFLHR